MGFSDAEAIMFVDGQLVRAGDATIAALDHAVTVGDGVFEATKVIHGQAWAMTRHLNRMERSVAALELPPIDRTLIRYAVDQVLTANAGLLAPHSHCVLRITYTAGTGPLGSGRADRLTPRLLVAVTHHDPPPPTATAITVPWTRNETGALAGVKSTSYAENALALTRARRAGAHEAFFPNTVGHLCEGTRSNIFVGLGGRLVTPPLSDGPLAGVTRELVLEWTDAAEESLPMAALFEADAVFITSTGNDVTPIVAVDGRPIGPGQPGPLTAAAAQAWAEGQARGLEP
jgi:branched-chain amino acid aminotransferase